MISEWQITRNYKVQKDFKASRPGMMLWHWGLWFQILLDTNVNYQTVKITHHWAKAFSLFGPGIFKMPWREWQETRTRPWWVQPTRHFEMMGIENADQAHRVEHNAMSVRTHTLVGIYFCPDAFKAVLTGIKTKRSAFSSTCHCGCNRVTSLFLSLRKFTQMLTDLVGKAAKTERC